MTSRQELLRRISEVLAEAKEASKVEGAYELLPSIVEGLAKMQEGLGLSSAERRKLAGGVGYLVLDNYTFSEGELGSKILAVADDFAAFPNEREG